ncbi:MAG TPA: DUF1080 domain-containing protein [Tepidisphaeraceae bacterium]|nr:DUF1080 domain-containing protein [Tepidisphaeraceae bacterium]
MKLLLAISCILFFSILPASFAADAPASSGPFVIAPTIPSLTDSEKQAGWKLLFDGKTTTGWRGLGRDDFPDQIWEVRDGCLHCRGGKKADDLVTVDKYDNFELAFDWMVPKRLGNSGVKYRVQEKKGNGFAFGCEYQCMYDPGANGKDATGSLYDVLPPKGKHLNPQGQFNTSRILVSGNHVEHWLNGVRVLQYEFGSDEFKKAVAKSKFKNSRTWAKEPLGYIVLQDHNDEVYFRNLKIRTRPKSE